MEAWHWYISRKKHPQEREEKRREEVAIGLLNLLFPHQYIYINIFFLFLHLFNSLFNQLGIKIYEKSDLKIKKIKKIVFI